MYLLVPEALGNDPSSRSWIMTTDDNSRHQVIMTGMAFTSNGRVLSYSFYAGGLGDGVVQVRSHSNHPMKAQLDLPVTAHCS
eukprot:SAG11_NODE_586_length_8341_cov_33.741204_4_plen_82_part_00